MACMKVGSKSCEFRREGQAWFCTSGFSSDVTVEVGNMSFHLHQFPLMSRSGCMDKLIKEASRGGGEVCVIQIPPIPGNAKTFEIIAKFCYDTKLDLTAANVIHLRMAAEILEMTEDFGEGNLIVQAEMFFNQVVLESWKDTIVALQTCNDMLPLADDLHIVKRCIDSISAKCRSLNLFGEPVEYKSILSPGGSSLWNGIKAEMGPSNSIPEWWHEDVSCLSLPIYKRLISTMGYRGVGEETIAISLASYVRRHVPGLKRLRISSELGTHAILMPPTLTSEQDQKLILEEICSLLPIQKGLMPTKLLFGLLRNALIVQANPICISTLERFIGLQLDEATLEDLLMPNYSHSMDTLYNIDSVQRILEHFLSNTDQATVGSSPYSAEGEQSFSSPFVQLITAVTRVMDNFLAEIASDVNLKPSKFQTIVASVPDYARPLADGLYHAIDTFLKAHPWLDEAERERLCSYIDYQKLSVQACTHAAQNERLPLRVIVQVLFFDQLQLKSSVANCFVTSDNLDLLRACKHGNAGVAVHSGEWAVSGRGGQEMKVDMEKMRARVNELEKECSNMRQAIEKMGKSKNHQWSIPSGWFTFAKMQMCSTQKGAVVEQKSLDKKNGKSKPMATEEYDSFGLES